MHRFPIVMLLLVSCAAERGGDPTTATTTDAESSTSAGTSTTTGSSTAPTPTSSSDTTATDSTGGAPACNGRADACLLRLDEVLLPATHNSIASAAYGFPALNRNQEHGLRRQLDDGIRGLLLDVTEYEGGTWLCHGPCSLAKLAHLDAIAEIGEFLDEHPREVIVIIYEDTAGAGAIEADWQASGHEGKLIELDGTGFPTLGELVDAGTRVLVTAENGGPPPAWFHHAWDTVWDTPYTFHALDELSCAMNRGTPGVGLYLVNHWISTDLDLPDESSAAAANASDVLSARLEACTAQWQHPVNLLAVDFYEQGDLFAVVDAHAP